MKSPRPAKIDYEAIAGKRPRFRVTGCYRDGSTKTLGRVEQRWFRHIRQYGWEATAADGSHRAVHEHRWQAAAALALDNTGYPDPVIIRLPGA